MSNVDTTTKIEVAADLKKLRASIIRSAELLGSKQADKFEGLDRHLFLLLAMSTASSIMSRRHDAAKEMIRNEFFDKIDAVQPREDLVIAQTDVFTLNCAKKAPVQRVDNKRLVTALRKAGVSADVINAALEGATVTNRSATSLVVSFL